MVVLDVTARIWEIHSQSLSMSLSNASVKLSKNQRYSPAVKKERIAPVKVISSMELLNLRTRRKNHFHSKKCSKQTSMSFLLTDSKRLFAVMRNLMIHFQESLSNATVMILKRSVLIRLMPLKLFLLLQRRLHQLKKMLKPWRNLSKIKLKKLMRNRKKMKRQH